jgi:hypothetical protein
MKWMFIENKKAVCSFLFYLTTLSQVHMACNGKMIRSGKLGMTWKGDAVSCINLLKSKFVQIIFKNSVRTSKKTQHFSITKINWLKLFKEIITVYSGNHTKHINTLCRQIAVLLVVKAGGTYSYHWTFEGLEHYHSICLEAFKKTTRHMSKDSHLSVRELNLGPPKHKGELTTQP